MKFSQLFTETKSPELIRAEVYKWLKKKHKITATYLDKDFISDKVLDYNDEIKVHINTTDYDKPVFDIEYK